MEVIIPIRTIDWKEPAYKFLSFPIDYSEVQISILSTLHPLCPKTGFLYTVASITCLCFSPFPISIILPPHSCYPGVVPPSETLAYKLCF